MLPIFCAVDAVWAALRNNDAARVHQWRADLGADLIGLCADLITSLKLSLVGNEVFNMLAEHISPEMLALVETLRKPEAPPADHRSHFKGTVVPR